MRRLADLIPSSHRCTATIRLLFGVGLTFVTTFMVMEGTLLRSEGGRR